jgi:hypothetical protein
MFYFGVSAVVQTDGATPLYIASRNGHVEVVRALVGAGAAVNQAKVCESWLAFGIRMHVGGWTWGGFGAHGALRRAEAVDVGQDLWVCAIGCE